MVLSQGRDQMADGEAPMARAKLHAMTEGPQEDWSNISTATRAFSAEFPERLLKHLRLLEGDCGGFAVDRMTHSLQTATRAFKDGRDEEYVVCALIHDIGDILMPSNHAELGATMLMRYLSE